MSQTEVHKGVAKPTGLTVVEFLNANIPLIEDYYVDQINDDPREVFYNGLKCGYEKYIEYNGQVFELFNERLDEFGFAMGDKNPDGSFNYFVNFYNGGCSLSEAVADAIKGAE